MKDKLDDHVTGDVGVFSDTDPVGPVLQPETLCLYVNNRAMQILWLKPQTRLCRRPPHVVRSRDCHNNQAAIEGFVSQNS